MSELLTALGEDTSKEWSDEELDALIGKLAGSQLIKASRVLGIPLAKKAEMRRVNIKNVVMR